MKCKFLNKGKKCQFLQKNTVPLQQKLIRHPLQTNQSRDCGSGVSGYLPISNYSYSNGQTTKNVQKNHEILKTPKTLKSSIFFQVRDHPAPIGEVAFVVVILLSYYHNTKWLKSFSVPSLGFQHILSRLPLLQGSLPKNKGSSGNNFLRRTCQ